MLGRILRFLGRLAIFLGNFAPLFAVVLIIYWGTPEQTVSEALTVASFSCLLYWHHLLSASTKKTVKYAIKDLKIRESDDPISAIIGYFLTYTVSLPSVAVIGGLKGLSVLLSLLVVIYLALYENKIAFFNPFLTLFSYKMYRIETEDEAQGYLIVKIKGIDWKPSGTVQAVALDDFLYISRIIENNLVTV